MLHLKCCIPIGLALQGRDCIQVTTTLEVGSQRCNGNVLTPLPHNPNANPNTDIHTNMRMCVYIRDGT